jgi:hypothetical protein
MTCGEAPAETTNEILGWTVMVCQIPSGKPADIASTARTGSIAPCAPETCHIPFKMRHMVRSAVN